MTVPLPVSEVLLAQNMYQPSHTQNINRMNLRHTILCLAASLLAAGCSSVKSIFGGGDKTPTSSTTTHHHRTTNSWHVATSTTDTTHRMDAGLDSVKDSLPDHSWGQLSPEIPAAEHPQFTFGETESANIRIPLRYNNPFTGSDNQLVLSSDALNETFHYPYPGKVISPFGARGRSNHTGMDIKAVPSDTIRAAWSGVVRMSKPYSGYGNVVVIRHYNGMETVYAHQTRNLVKVNDVVRGGDPIGLAGRTGRATTEHLHFEIRIAGQPINPALIVDPDSRTLRENRVYYCYNRNGQISVTTEPKPGFLLTDNDQRASDAVVASSTLASKASSIASQTASQSTTESKSSTSSKKATSATSSSKQYHTVKHGETLSHIAVNNSTTVAKLCALNHIKPTTVLQIKQKIRVR